MTDNYIFDFGKVLVDFSAVKLSGFYTDNETDTKIISEVFFDRLYWDKLDDGTITDEELKRLASKRVDERIAKIGCKTYDNWVGNLPEISGMREIIKKLKSMGKKVFLLSNISEGFAKKYKTYPHLNSLLSLFDGLVFSGVIHKTKPNEDIYKYLLDKYNLSAADCTFIDDSEININGAKKLGIQTYLFDGNSKKLSDYIFS